MVRRQENIIVRTLDTVLRQRGFSRQKTLWFLPGPETILVVGLQKSRWSKTYYVDLGVSIRQLAPELTPKINKCPISHRLELLVRDHLLSSLPQTTPSTDESSKNNIFQQITKDPLTRIIIPKNDPGFFDAKGMHVPKIFKALDLEDDSISEPDREAVIKEAMLTHGLPFLFNFESLDKIKKQLLKAHGSSTMIWGIVYEFLGCPLPR